MRTRDRNVHNFIHQFASLFASCRVLLVCLSYVVGLVRISARLPSPVVAPPRPLRPTRPTPTRSLIPSTSFPPPSLSPLLLFPCLSWPCIVLSASSRSSADTRTADPSHKHTQTTRTEKVGSMHEETRGRSEAEAQSEHRSRRVSSLTQQIRVLRVQVAARSAATSQRFRSARKNTISELR